LTWHGGRVSIVLMRRFGAFLLAMGFALSFVATCLSVCFGGAGSDHSCCPQGEESVSAVGRDCCSVVPGESRTEAKAVVVFGVTAHTPPVVADGAPIGLPPVRSATLAASPPLVLRI
jgi:hypothetical protein